jgi:hypothetical protein
MSGFPASFEGIIKVGNLFLTAFAAVCGIVKWFEPDFSIGGLMNGFLVLIVSAILFSVELAPVTVVQYLSFLRFGWGKGILFILLGTLFAERWALWMACWVIFWLWGVVIIGLGFVKSSGPGSPAAPASDGYSTPEPGVVGNEGYDSYILK